MMREVPTAYIATYAVVFAVTLYEEWKWTDMFIVPRREIEQVVKPE